LSLTQKSGKKCRFAKVSLERQGALRQQFNNTNETEFIIKAVGDICPGDKSILGLGICSLMKQHGTDFPFKKIEGAFHNADIVLGNLEGLLSYKMVKTQTPKINFCGLPEFAKELKKQGFNVINVANNHVLEHGVDLFLETVNILKNAGLQIIGLRDTEKYYSKPIFIIKDKKKVGIVGYNWIGKDKFKDADKCISQSHDSVVNYTWHRDKFTDEENRKVATQKNSNVICDIKQLKNDCDYIILVTHWGYEFVSNPPYGVTLEARSFIDAGADLIIGSHPHVLQGREYYNGKWIFYSLGNFLFDMRGSKERQSMILEYNINKGKQDDYNLALFKLNKCFQPVAAISKETVNISNIINQSSRDIESENSSVKLDDDKIYKLFESEYNKRKFYTISYHLQAIPSNPTVIKIILRKVYNLITLLLLRIRGEKIRW